MGLKTGKQEKERMAKVAALGCCICGGPAEIHHLAGAGMALRSENSIPLCHAHHRTGGYGVAIHAGTKTWEKRYGSQLYWLDKINEMIE